MEVSIHDAQSDLSKFIQHVEAGEEVVITRNGKPIANLVPIPSTPPKRYKAGALKGRLFVPDDFLSPDSEQDKQIERSFTDPKL